MQSPPSLASIAEFAAGTRRIVELGGTPYIHSVFPDATDFFCTDSTIAPRAPERGLHVLTPFTVARLVRALRHPDLGLVVLRVNRHAAWSPSKIQRAFFHRRVLRGDFPLFSMFGVHMVRARHVPVAAVDQDDAPLLMRHNLGILDRSDAYFMREIPGDRWKLLMSTAHADLPTPRLRRKAKWLRRLEKIETISLGVPLRLDPDTVPRGLKKTADIFFAGAVEGNSWQRRRGLQELQALKAEGIRVDIPDERLSLEAFHRRCAAAWLTWSPDGLGHDCMRHYEAALCGSVPVIGRAPIERHRPFADGIHAFYYDIEPGGLTASVRAALADKHRLTEIAAAARAHTIAHHTPTANTHHIVETTLKNHARRQPR